MMELPERMRNRTNRRQVAQKAIVGLGTAAVPAVSIKNGAFALIDANGERIQIETPYLDCIIIDVNEKGVQRTFWGLGPDGQPKQYDDAGLPPVCFSDNGVGASQNAPEPQSVSCGACPMKQFNWPSKIDATKRTSACRPIKKLAVLAFTEGVKDSEGCYDGYPVTDATDNAAAFVLRVPVTSHENLRVYGDQFRGQEFDLSEVVTRITFDREAKGQKLEFAPFAFLNDVTEADVEKILETQVTDQLVGRNDQPIAELPGKATAEPVERPKPVVPPQTAAPMQIAHATPAKAARGRPRTKAVAPEETSGPFAAPQQAHVDTAPQRKAPFASAPSHGIVTNAGQPPESVEKALDSLFNLKTER